MPPSRSPYSYNNDKSRRYSQSNFSIGTCLSVLASFIAFINIIQFFSDQSIWTLFQPINGAGIVRSLLHSNCKDFHPECRFQSEQGFCSEYEPAMSVECPRSCSTCDLIDYDTRCTDERLYPDESDLPPSLYIEDVFIKGNSLFKKGGLTKMFSTIQTRVGFKYKVTIKSISPWIVTLDNFLSDAEVEKLTNGLEAWQPFPKSEIDKNLFSGDVITCRDECRNVSYYYCYFCIHMRTF